MTRKDFGRLVACLRKEQPTLHGNTMTREELKERTGLSTEVIGNIERGDLVKLDGDTLVRLANAFELTSGERQEFFLAALAIEEADIVRPGSDPHTTLADLFNLLGQIEAPAFIHDVYMDMVAANYASLGLLGIGCDRLRDADARLDGYNVMRFMFSDEFGFRELMGLAWGEVARYNMHYFRALTLRHRQCSYFHCLFQRLWTYPQFRLYWDLTSRYRDPQDDHHGDDSAHFDYVHPAFGVRLAYITATSVHLTPYGPLRCVIYVPIHSETATVFGRVVKAVGPGAYRLASWPQKHRPAPGAPPGTARRAS